MLRKSLYAVVVALLVPATVQTQEFEFEVVADAEASAVKSQGRTGTCWSFATTSMLESELVRQGKEPVDISEMFFVRMNYPLKVANYVRLHGTAAMGQGSLGGDVLRALRLYGVVPEAAYPGRRYGAEEHDHSEMHSVLRGASDALVEARQLSPVWADAVEGILDAYLGEPPETFMYGGQSYTPHSFAEALGIDADDYVELTSFSHHPFYTSFAVEVPDNWARNVSFNLPLDELIEVMDHAIEHGFTIDWDGDVSERSFCQNNGVAVWPLKTWAERDAAERNTMCAAPEPEVEVTQDVRQAGFDDYTSTDDHLMHVTGLARDQHGTKYYITKNSWGLTGPQDGFIYMSEAYVRAKTISILLHRDALPPSVAARMDE
ncbi:MAG: C1 family peptidase [Gemmatimonadales bacterium]|jgi:aminopeptidase C